MPLAYPETRRSDQTDDYHGSAIADPYRWLEDTYSEETLAWVDAQNEVTFGWLKESPQREQYQRRLTELWNYERFGLPRKRGGRYFFTRNDGLQNQSVLYVADGLDGEPRVLLDPNTLSEDGTVALAGWVASKDGKRLAYGLATAGSDWREWKVMDVGSAEPLQDHLRWVKFSGISWLPDGSGFFYSRYDEPAEGDEFSQVNYFQKLYFHRIGDEQAKDRLVYERPDEKEWGFSGHVTEDGDYLVISVWRGTEHKNNVFYQRLGAGETPIVELLPGFEAEFGFLGNLGPQFYFATDWDAPNQRIIRIDIEHPDRRETIVPERDDVLNGANLVGGRLVTSYLHDAHTVVRIHGLDGKHERDLELPALGSAGGFGGRQDDPETFYSFSNFTTPGAIYQYNVETGEQRVFREPRVAFDPSQFETKQVFVESKDGARVPMFITHKRGLELTGDHPTLLYGYGGFDISLTPSFSVSNVVWLERGGVYAVANLRGGGEYGRDWHEAGMKHRKQNVFDDFIAAAEWLVANKYTSPRRLAVKGGSNGGLLVGAVMTQRPELFGAALPSVGVMDMLRFHKFTIGWAWVSEYGSSDDADEFRTLLRYSPLHNLKAGTSYPATMVMTADHDDRVVPGHSFKFAAELQRCHNGETPVLIRIEKSAGHGAGTPTSKRIEEAADQLTFLRKALGVD
ncbi:MAG: S9 family peptidase [Planctomycetales bacterium]|nr:S9 family peptidase [Planctomycetales bacterium]